MSQAETLLNTLAVSDNIHAHTVSDSDAYFVINPVTRVIEHPSYESIVLMQRDHNSSVFTFELPRYVDGHDMTLCTAVKVHYNNISADAVTENADVADLYDLRVNPKDTSKVICSWTIRRQATQLAGTLNFLVQYLCTDSEGNETYEWHTDIYSAIEVRQGRNNGPAAVIEYTDILEQWRAKIFGAKDSLLIDLVNASEEQQAAIVAIGESQVDAIELKGAETLESIPADYTTTYNMADEAYRKRADAITINDSGTVIAMDDASDNYVQGLKLYGRTEQFTTTGKNLLENNIYDMSYNGITITKNADKSFYVNGTATDNCYFTLNSGINLPTGTYRLSGCASGASPTTYILYATHDEFYAQDVGDGVEFDYDSETPLPIRFAVYKNAVMSNVLIKPMLCLASENTSYEPYTGGKASPNPDYLQELVSIENPTAYIYGKNLATTINDGNVAGSGITITYTRGTSEVILNGTSNDQTSYGGVFRVALAPGTYTASIYGLNKHNTICDRAYVYNNQAKKVVINYIQTGVPRTFTITEYCNLQIDIVVNGESTYDNQLVRFQIEKGTEATEYEPFIAKQSLAFDHTLRAIPVESGGNYTDSNGQQWIADYVDCDNKQLVRRIGTAVLDETRSYHINAYRLQEGLYVFGTNFKTSGAYELPIYADKLLYQQWGYLTPTNRNKIYSVSDGIFVYLDDQTINTVEAFMTFITENPISFYYIMEKPVIESLTDEEITVYKALRTNKVNTTITNDCGAYMEVSYAADTQTYINNNYVSKSVMEDVLNRLAALEAE